MEKIQINITIPAEWKSRLQIIAASKSIAEKRKYSYQDLVREAIESSINKYSYRFTEKREKK